MLTAGADLQLSNCFVVDSGGVARRRCLFSLATESCMRDRRNKDRMAILRKLLEYGLSGDVQVPG